MGAKCKDKDKDMGIKVNDMGKNNGALRGNRRRHSGYRAMSPGPPTYLHSYPICNMRPT